MKFFKHIIPALALIVITSSCEKESRFPEVENGANAQFTRALGVPATAASFNNATLSRANPAVKDNFTLKIVESGNVAQVRLMIDYIKGNTTKTRQYEEVKNWPVNYSLSLNDLIAVFAADGVTSGTVANGDRFILRTDFTLNSGTVINSQATVLTSAPYAIRLTYTVGN